MSCQWSLNEVGGLGLSCEGKRGEVEGMGRKGKVSEER